MNFKRTLSPGPRLNPRNPLSNHDPGFNLDRVSLSAGHRHRTQGRNNPQSTRRYFRTYRAHHRDCKRAGNCRPGPHSIGHSQGCSRNVCPIIAPGVHSTIRTTSGFLPSCLRGKSQPHPAPETVCDLPRHPCCNIVQIGCDRVPGQRQIHTRLIIQELTERPPYLEAVYQEAIFDFLSAGLSVDIIGDFPGNLEESIKVPFRFRLR